MSPFLGPVLSTGILGAALLTDLKTRKIPNKLILISSGLAVVFQLVLGGWPSLWIGLGGFSAALVLSLPLVLLRALGAGDMKILMAFGLSSDWQTVVYTAGASVFFAAAIGVVQAGLAGHLRVLVINAVGLLSSKHRAPDASLHRIPYTVALMLGWVFYFGLTQLGVTL